MRLQRIRGDSEIVLRGEVIPSQGVLGSFLPKWHRRPHQPVNAFLPNVS
jgi:hypothetical protein